MEFTNESQNVFFLQGRAEQGNEASKEEKCSYCLAFQCAPVLAGIKVSNLLIIKEPLCNRAKKEISEAGTNYCLLYSSKKRYIYLIYRQKELLKLLKKADIIPYLNQSGYDISETKEIGISGVLNQLKFRFKESFEKKRDFPHEIGVFMGYPIEDVLSFVENEGHNYKLSGYWKVYHKQEVALRVFKQYDLARFTAVRHIRGGGALSQLKTMFIEAYRESLLNTDAGLCSLRA